MRDLLHDEIDALESLREDGREIVEGLRQSLIDVLRRQKHSGNLQDALSESMAVISAFVADEFQGPKAVRIGYDFARKRADRAKGRG